MFRAFYNSGNSGLTFWSPNINIFRDPRWGRGQETPGEDPYLNAEYARNFVAGFQGDEQRVGFIKASACCKHFAAHSIEEDRNSFDAIVTEQDMIDTYLPAFKACVENNVSSIMTAYSAINGIPATAHKHYITNVIRNEWNFDGYIVSDCGAVDDVFYQHNYTKTESETCRTVLDAGMDIECGRFLNNFLHGAVVDGLVTESMIDTAVSRGLRVLMRLGYFEKDDTRPYTEFQAQHVDSDYHKQLSLEAARSSIVLLKNDPNEVTGIPLLPLEQNNFENNRLALIGPHVNGSSVFLGNYHGIPSSIKVPLEEIRKYVPNVEWENGCDVESFDDSHLNGAIQLAGKSSQVVLFVGINAEIEAEVGDRANISLTGLQSELIRRILNVIEEPIILFIISGGVIDLSQYKNDPRVGAIVWAGYIGQSAGEAIADVLFGNYNPSGRLTQTFYASSYLEQITKQNMNMRPVNGSPGRTYRFFTGEAVYGFGYGLSYTTYEYAFLSSDDILISSDKIDCEQVDLSVRNVGRRKGDHSILWFLAPPNAGQEGNPIMNLVYFDKLHNIMATERRQSSICLNRDMFRLTTERAETIIVPGQWTLIVGDLNRRVLVT